MQYERCLDDLDLSHRDQKMLVVDQGINQIEELSNLDDAEVYPLLKLLRRPCGIIPNPNAAVAGQTVNITAPVMLVSMRAATPEAITTR